MTSLHDPTADVVISELHDRGACLTVQRNERSENVLVDVETGSWAAVYQDDGRWLVRQDGPEALWDQVEEQFGRRCAAGAPTLQGFTVTVTPEGQTISW
ncbi:hypothetical protein [Streptomyces afghaniensis]|uniref:hypothetical protein n=1 Tax=Streptomyces afghaniensis TaxID=66865 RepID=UPI0027D78741|nr:hypothetical protein [Streptomyces afghaniensis]